MPVAATHPHTLQELIAQLAAQNPDDVVVTIDGEPETAEGLRRRVVSAANQLGALGMRPGDRLALYGVNSLEWLVVWLACAAFGLRVIPINVAFRGEFLVHQLRQSDVKLVFVDGDLAGAIAEVAGALPSLKVALVHGAGPAAALPSAVQVLDSGYLAEGDCTEIADAPPSNGGEPFCVFYTSGTTGPSKGAVVTQQYLLSGAATIAHGFEFGPNDCIYGALPLFHFGGSVGLLLSGLLSGAKVALDSSFSVSGFWARVREERATVFVGVGPMVNMVFGSGGLLPEPAEMPIRLVLAAPVAPDVRALIEREYDCVVRGVYGMTEIFPLCLHPLAGPAPTGSAGYLNPDFELKIVGEDGKEVPQGAAGEITAKPRRDHVMFAGYEPVPDGAAPPPLEWFATGDLGRLDETGSLYFVDRKKDAIRRRGENISSFEVERAYLGHPAVAECAAHAVPSDVGEDDVKLCVVLASGAAVPTAHELFVHGEDTLPGYAVPRYLEFLDVLPKTVTGRVRKYELRERASTGQVWDRTVLDGTKR
ncbi:AMP-binding protein [Mycolicibacterium austroafricanum]|uniref:AMP-binding protein n=1 Tax=Mycolicibacterium austroafricanum TaxID=39687 RepID=UPI001CA37C37|nr:AMP-binding protein [Mycolicibacterium austroafricanum]QZT58565.1 AMP-binding protein [Mycolicibacterium austroafricanum]